MNEPIPNPASENAPPPPSSPPTTRRKPATDEELARDYPSCVLRENPNPLVESRRLDRRGEILRRLNLTEHDVANLPRITPQILAAFGTVKAAVRVLRGDDAPDSLRFMETWNTLSKHDQTAVRIEHVIRASGLTARRFMEILAGASMEYSATVSKLIVSKSQPKVLKATVKAATDSVPIVIYNRETKAEEIVGHTNGDVKAMELFHKITGALPTPKGANFTFNQQINRVDDAPKQQTPLQAMDAFLLEIDDVRKPKQLEAKIEPVIPVEMPDGAPEIEYLDLGDMS